MEAIGHVDIDPAIVPDTLLVILMAIINQGVSHPRGVFPKERNDSEWLPYEVEV